MAPRWPGEIALALEENTNGNISGVNGSGKEIFPAVVGCWRATVYSPNVGRDDAMYRDPYSWPLPVGEWREYHRYDALAATAYAATQDEALALARAALTRGMAEREGFAAKTLADSAKNPPIAAPIPVLAGPSEQPSFDFGCAA